MKTDKVTDIMFEIDDIVFYEGFGLCHILEIENRIFNDVIQKYYVLKPISDCASLSTNISVSVDTNRILRKVNDKATALSIIDKLSSINQEWETSYRKREQFYKESLESGELWNFALVVLYVYKERLKYQIDKKPFPSKDTQYYTKAEMYFNQEMGYILGIPQQDVPDFISKRINSNLDL